MKNKQHIKPTEAELEILNILWQSGPATVKEVNEQLSLTRQVGYTTTLKLMQIMHDKQLLSREIATGRVHIYSPLVSREQASGQMVQRMIETLFNGSAMQLVMQTLGNHKPSTKELQQIKEYLEQKMKNN